MHIRAYWPTVSAKDRGIPKLQTMLYLIYQSYLILILKASSKFGTIIFVPLLQLPHHYRNLQRKYADHY
jgi:hypothetical protein